IPCPTGDCPPDQNYGGNPNDHRPIPAGDGTGNHGNDLKSYTTSAKPIGGYPWQAIDELATVGVQLLVSELTGSNVSTEIAGYIQMAGDGVILLTSKGKSAAKSVLKSVDEGIEFTTDLSKSKAKTRSGHRNAAN